MFKFVHMHTSAHIGLHLHVRARCAWGVSGIGMLCMHINKTTQIRTFHEYVKY